MQDRNERVRGAAGTASKAVSRMLHWVYGKDEDEFANRLLMGFMTVLGGSVLLLVAGLLLCAVVEFPVHVLCACGVAVAAVTLLVLIGRLFD